MIELTGTEKQIKYATDIRNEMFYILNTVRNYYFPIIESDWSWRTKSRFKNFEDFKEYKIELLDKEFKKLFDYPQNQMINKYELSFENWNILIYDSGNIIIKGGYINGNNSW